MQVRLMINKRMKTSNFRDLFERDRNLRQSRTNTSLAPTNTPPSSLGDETYDAVDGTTSGMHTGYTHTRGVRMYIKVTNSEVPDNADFHDDVRSSSDEEPAKNKEKLVDKTAGPVLAIMSAPVVSRKHQE